MCIGTAPSLLGQALPPCYANAQFTGGICVGDTITLYSNGSSCSTCTYQWSTSSSFPFATLVAGGGINDSWATYTFTHPANKATEYCPISCIYTPQPGTFCDPNAPMSTTYDQWDLSILGLLQLSNLTLLNGPYDGDTSKVWIYERSGWPQSAHHDYSARVYSVSGGTLDTAIVDPGYILPVLADTLHIRWSNTHQRQLECGAPYIVYSQWVGNTWPQTCSNYSEVIPPQPLNNPFPIGADTVCPGDTVVYYTTPVPGATYNWTTSGGTVVSGQGTDQVSVLWNSVPGSITCARTISGSTLSETRTVNSFTPTPGNINFPDTATYCVGTPLVLDVTGPMATYAWSTGATTPTIAVMDSGTYTVTVTYTSCGTTTVLSDSSVVLRQVPITPNLGPDRTFCTDTTQFFTLPSHFTSAHWNNSFLSTLTWQTNNSGPLTVATIDTNGCPGADTVILNGIAPPNLTLSATGDFCQGDSLLLNPGFQGGGASFLWSTGATSQSIFAKAAGTYSVEVNKNGCVRIDSTVVTVVPVPTVNLGPDTTICNGDSIQLDAGVLGYWSTGATGQTIWVSQTGQYSVAVIANGCVGQDTVDVVVMTDCVWPGDCDNDGIANNADVLALGAMLGQVGPTRANASLNWEAQVASDWSVTQGSGANAKHADSDGNGIVNQDDTLAIDLNFGLVHNKVNGTQTGIPLYLEADQDTFPAGGTAWFTLYLGDASIPADSVYGVAFTISYDASLVTADGLVQADFANNWLTGNGQRLSYSRDEPTVGRGDFALVRTNGVDTSGYGAIARFSLDIRPDIGNNVPQATEDLFLELFGVTLVNAQLDDLGVTWTGDSTVLLQTATAVDGPVASAQLEVYPNPAREHVRLRMLGAEMKSWTLVDMRGAVLAADSEVGQAAAELEVKTLPDGVYFIQVQDQWGQVHRQKLVLLR